MIIFYQYLIFLKFVICRDGCDKGDIEDIFGILYDFYDKECC